MLGKVELKDQQTVILTSGRDTLGSSGLITLVLGIGGVEGSTDCSLNVWYGYS